MNHTILNINTNNLKYINHDPEILGGAAVIKGTRIPVSRLIYLMGIGLSAQLIKEYEYPQLDLNTIKGTLSDITKILDSLKDAQIPQVQSAS